MSYWDTSCLVKLYTPEQDSSVFRTYAGQSTPIVSSEIARFELWTTLRRKESENLLASGEAALIMRVFEADVGNGDLHLIPVDPLMTAAFQSAVESCFGFSPPLFIRTLDAIHLATAKSSGNAEIVATDIRLRAAALALGFTVYPLP
jgi:predicted nucleic acid-binding protein